MRTISRRFRVLLLVPLLVFTSVLLGTKVTEAAGGIYLNPTSGPAGSSFTVYGSNYQTNEVVTVSFNGMTGTATASPAGTFTTSFNVSPGTAPATYPVTATGQQPGTAVAYFTVTAAQPGPNYSLSKSVTVSGQGSGTTAYPGDTLTYDIHYANTGVTGSQTATISDTIGTGQAFVSASGPGCNPSGPTTGGYYPGVTVNCTVPAAGSGDVYITTSVLGGYSGPIRNQASMQIGSTVVTSNVTTVYVPGPAPAPVTPTTPVYTGPFFANAVFAICGPVTAYSPAGAGAGSITIAGQNFSLPAGTAIPGLTATPVGANICLVVTSTNGVNAGTYVVPNLSGTSLVCGAIAGVSGTTVNIGGANFTWTSAVPFTYLPGQSGCFLLNSNGQIAGVLNGVPTAIHFLDMSRPYRLGHNWAE